MMSDQEFESYAIGKLIDPPTGWLYGFPKVYKPEPGEDMAGFLARNYYPTKDITFALKYMRVIGE